jgi:hypothetical protein
MIKALALSLTSNDIEAALKEVCVPSSTAFSAAEFCSKLTWAETGAKEVKRFKVLEHEVELFELFESFCRSKERHPNPTKPLTESLSPGGGQVMNLAEFLDFAKFTDLMPVEVELKLESGSDRVKINRQSIQVVKLSKKSLLSRTVLVLVLMQDVFFFHSILLLLRYFVQ